MRRLAYVLLACVTIVVALFVLLSSSVTDESVRSAAAGRIEALTGYAVEIRGRTSMSVFPSPGFEIRDVVLALPGDTGKADTGEDGMPTGMVASIDTLRGSVDLLPLLTGRVKVGDFVLVRPRLNLIADADNNAEWALSRQDDILIGSVRVEDGAIGYVDHSGDRYDVSAINATIAWPRLSAPLDVTGSLVWNGEILKLDIDADTPLDFMRRGSSRSRLRIESGIVNATFDGMAHLTSDPQLEGQIGLTAPSTRALLRWLGMNPGLGAGLNTLELSGDLNLLPESMALSGLELSLDGNEAEGGLNFTRGEHGTELQGTLAFDALDLGKYRAPLPDGADAPPDPAAAMAKSVDLSSLDMMAVDLRVSAGSVRYGELRFERSAGTITVRNGTLDIGVGEAYLYGGNAQGGISAKPVHGGTRVKATLKLENADIGPLLQVLSGRQLVRGATNGRINLAGSGRTVAEIVADLSGEAKLKITDGALAGIDVLTLLEVIKAGRIEGWPALTATTETRINELTASFIVTKGNATTDDFHLTGPNIEVTADGEIRLVSASVAGHGTADLREAAAVTGANSNGLLSVPFVIEGPITRPSIYPDPIWLLSRSAASPEQIDKVREELKQKKPEEVIDDLIQRGLDLSPGPKASDPQATVPQQ